jgi:hypothetical protein
MNHRQHTVPEVQAILLIYLDTFPKQRSPVQADQRRHDEVRNGLANCCLEAAAAGKLMPCLREKKKSG